MWRVSEFTNYPRNENEQRAQHMHKKICYILQLLLIWNRWLRFIEIDSIGNICDGREKKINQQELSTDNFIGKKLNPQNIFHTINKKMEACRTNEHSKYKNRGTSRIESTTHTKKNYSNQKNRRILSIHLFASLVFHVAFFVLPVPGLFFHSLFVSKSWYAHITIIYINFLLSYKLLLHKNTKYLFIYCTDVIVFYLCVFNTDAYLVYWCAMCMCG